MWCCVMPGAFGGKDSDGQPILKTFKVLTNNQTLAEALGVRLTSEEREWCRPLEGQRVTDSQVYPEKMVRTMLRVLRAEARSRDPLRFSKPKCVMYAKPVADEAGWRGALEKVSQLFAQLQPSPSTFARTNNFTRTLQRWFLGKSPEFKWL